MKFNLNYIIHKIKIKNMNEKNNPKEKIIEKPKIKSKIHPLIRLSFFTAFIILSFLFNIEAIALVNENFKYQTFYLKMISFFILCLFPITEYDKMKSIMIFLPILVLLFFHVTFIPLSNMFLSFLSFFTKIYSLAYLRIWLDKFAMIKYKTLLIYILNIFALSGDKISIIINRYINYNKIANKIVLLQFVIFVAFFIIPDKYFFIHNKISHYREIIKTNEENEDEKIIEKNENKKEEKEKKDIEEDSVSVFINFEKEEKIKAQRKARNAKFKNLYELFINPCYIFSILGKSSLFFLIALIDYALKDFCLKVISQDETSLIFNNYENIIATLSISGSIFGGVLSIFIGGYEEITSCLVVSISDFILIICCYYLSYTKYFIVLLISLCSSFFFINVIMGDIEGFIIKSIPLKYKELGLNFSGLLSTIGCFCARNIYDYIKITFEKTLEFFAWRFCLCSFLFGFFSILLACTYRYRDILKTKKIKEKKEKEGEMEDIEWEENLETPTLNKRYYRENININNNLDNGDSYEELFNDNSYSLDSTGEKRKFSSTKTFDSVTS